MMTVPATATPVSNEAPANNMAALGFYADAAGDIVHVVGSGRSSVDASPVVFFVRLEDAAKLLWAAPLQGWHERFQPVRVKQERFGMQPWVSMLPTPERGMYRHIDGGIYQVLGVGCDEKSEEPVVVYQHVWPFPPGTWVRPHPEWAARFTRVSPREVDLAMAVDRIEAQLTIHSAKQARKATAARTGST